MGRALCLGAHLNFRGKMKFQKWRKHFLKDKTEIERPAVEEKDAFQEPHRFLDKKGGYWEYARTYTDRLVVRSGFIRDGEIAWEEWTTLHDIELDQI